jgi:autotransporter translocation and assembly factor TamB
MEKKKKRKLWVKIPAVILAVIFILVVCAFIMLQTKTVKDLLAQYIERTVPQYTTTECIIGSITGNLLNRFEINDFKLTHQKSGELLVSARKVEVSYSIPMLINRVIWINKLSFDGILANLIQSEDGQWNFDIVKPQKDDGEPEKPSGNSGLGVEIRKLLVSNSSVRLIQPTEKGETGHVNIERYFKEIACQAEISINSEISAAIKHLALVSDQPDLKLTNLSGEIVYDSNSSLLTITNTEVNGINTAAAIEGKVGFQDDGPDLDLAVDLRKLNLSETAKIISLKETGRISPQDYISGKIKIDGLLSELVYQLDLKWMGSQQDGVQIISDGRVYIDESDGIGLDLKGKFIDFNPSVLPFGGVEAFYGDIDADFSLTGQHLDLPDQSGQAVITIHKSTIAEHTLDSCKVKVLLAGNDLTKIKLQLSSAFGKLEIGGNAAGILSAEKDNHIDVTAKIGKFNPKAFIKDTQINGEINAEIGGNIIIPKGFELEGISGILTCQVLPSKINEMAILKGNLDAAMQDKKIAINQLEVQTIFGRTELQGEVDVADRLLQLSAKAVIPDLNKCQGLFPEREDLKGLSGSFDISGDIGGKWDHPTISAWAKAGDFVFNEISAESFSAEIQWSGEKETLSASGKCEISDLKKEAIQLSKVHLEISGSQKSANVSMQILGKGSEKFVLSGDIYQWMDPEKQVLIDTISFESTDYLPLANQEPVKLSISKDNIVVQNMMLSSGEASFELKGNISFKQPTDVSALLKIHDFDLKRVSGFWAGGEKLKGMVSSDLRISGLLDSPVIDFSTSVQDASYDYFPASNFNIQAKYEALKASISATGFRQEGQFLDINGSSSLYLSLYPFKLSPDTGDVNFLMNLKQVDISEFSGFLEAVQGISGMISADLQVTGKSGDPDVTMKVLIDDVTYENYPVSDLDISLDYSAQKASIKSSVYNQNKRFLDARGNIPVRISLHPISFKPAPEGLDLSLLLDNFDISIISEIFDHPEYDITGVLNGKVKAIGNVLKPDVTGTFKLEDGSLILKKQNLIYEDLTASLNFKPGLFEVSSIEIKGDKEGVIHLSGTVSHKDLEVDEFNLKATGKNFYIPFYTGVDARIEPDLTFSGKITAPELTGKITVTEGRADLAQVFKRRPSEIKIVKAVTVENGLMKIPDQEPEPLAFMQDLSSDVNLQIPNNFWLKDGRDLAIEIRGDVLLKKNPQQSFTLFGSVNTVRGTYRFQGRHFTIKRGNLNFTGLEDINPAVDIEAHANIADATIIINLRGFLDKLELILNSDPAMDESEIIAYLIYGRAPDSLSEQESFNANQVALNITGQMAADKLHDMIGDSLGIDYLSIEPGSSETHKGSMSMGKYVTPDVFVIYRQGFDSHSPWELEVTYEINRNWELGTMVDEEDTAAMDIFWKHDF